MDQTVPPDSPRFLLSTVCGQTFTQVRGLFARTAIGVVHKPLPCFSTALTGAPHKLHTGLSTGVDN